MLTHKHIYRLRLDTQRLSWTQPFLHRSIFTNSLVDTKTILHTDIFAHISFYTHTMTHKLTHRALHTHPHTHTHTRTHTVWGKNAFTCFLHTTLVTKKPFCTSTFFTQRPFDTKTFLRTNSLYGRRDSCVKPACLQCNCHHSVHFVDQKRLCLFLCRAAICLS